ncbi:plasmodesmata-located protein 2-like [Salvia miltiorrhiza]|uniref:plasmodesmata-located protein 2-like n=1 Tax=Salvia miltiorrhiza TaxID=226208 RepID=UPI0025ACD017|nr:plasmodesmata-located protein 2-like [Salvia miltiorrhiza]
MINPTIIQFLIPFFLLIIAHSAKTLITDHHKLVYTQCSNHTSPNPSHVLLLPNLFQELITHSSKAAFFKTIVGDEKTAISGLFQCRKDLSSDECRNCVITSSDLSENLCGKILPARIQLRGCYVRYEGEEDGAEPETDAGPEQILHRACSKRKIKRDKFEVIKYAAFGEVERCVTSENGFCELAYESIRVSAQCVGSLRSTCDCGECVARAAEIACEDECRYSAAGEVYADGCFLSYDYIGEGGFGTYKGGGDRSPKLVAIVVGGLAVLAVGVGLCYFTKSCWKKKDVVIFGMFN